MLTSLKKGGIIILCALGAISFLMLILSFTSIPYYAYHSLGTTPADSTAPPPEVLVVMGGDGMPAPQALIRLYYASEIAEKYPQASIILALPMNENNDFHQLELMKKELILRGIDSNRILYEPTGFNTRTQAVAISEILAANLDERLLIITSPEHMYRSRKSFEKVGFSNVGGLPAFEKPGDEKTLKDDLKTKDVRVKNLSLRYNMWSYLHYELLVLREYAAIFYYWLKGWI